MRRLPILLLLLAPATARAWRLTDPPRMWPANAWPVPYTVDPACAEPVAAERSLPEIQAAFDAWDAVSCTGIGFAYAGPFSGVPEPGERVAPIHVRSDLESDLEPGVLAVSQAHFGATTSTLPSGER